MGAAGHPPAAGGGCGWTRRNPALAVLTDIEFICGARVLDQATPALVPTVLASDLASLGSEPSPAWCARAADAEHDRCASSGVKT